MNKNKICGVYKITSPSGKIYIGQAKDINKRKTQYKNLNESIKEQVRVYNSLKKHGWEAHNFEIIEECEFEQLNIRERYWQEFYNCIGKNGLNCKLVQTDSLPQVYTEKTIKKISQSVKNLNLVGDKNPNFGNKWTEEQKKKASEYLKSLNRKGKNNPNFGKSFTEERKANLSKAQKGKKLSEKHVEQIKNRMIKNNPFKDKSHTEEMAEYLRLSRVKYTVINVSTKEIFTGLIKASESIGVSASLLQKIFEGKRENTTNLILLSEYDENKQYEIKTGSVTKNQKRK